MAATKHAELIKKDSIDYLTTALFQLLETTDFNDIKISQLVKRAGVSRMAFYRNFETLEDVLTKYFQPLIDNLFVDIMENASQEDKLMRLTQFLDQLEEPIQLSIQRHFEYIIRQIFFDNMTRLYENDVRVQKVNNAKKHYWVSFMSSGVYNIWREWIVGGKQESIDEIRELIADLQKGSFTALN